MSKIAYIGVSKDETFKMFFRPSSDLYLCDDEIHFCYLDAEGADEEYHQDEFYTDFVVKTPEDVVRILNDYHMYRLDLNTNEPVKNARPAKEKEVLRVVTHAFERLERERESEQEIARTDRDTDCEMELD